MSYALSKGKFPKNPKGVTISKLCEEDFKNLKERNGTILFEHLSTLIKDLEKKGINPDIYKKERGISNLTISKKAMDLMVQYGWPGNVREMRNALERAVVMGNGKQIMPEDLPTFAGRPQYPGLEVGLPLKDAIDAFKKEFIVINLRNTNSTVMRTFNSLRWKFTPDIFPHGSPKKTEKD